jgi:hypothetical protein
MSRQIIDRPHPEKRPGEVFILNIVCSPKESLSYPFFKSARIGKDGYTSTGSMESPYQDEHGDICYAYPVFVKLKELQEAGYRVYKPYWEKHGNIRRRPNGEIIPKTLEYDKVAKDKYSTTFVGV